MPIHIGEFLPFVFIVALIRVPLLCNMWLLLVLYLMNVNLTSILSIFFNLTEAICS